MKRNSSGKAVYRSDYKPYPWTLKKATFRFEIGPDATRILSKMQFSLKDPDSKTGEIVLDGQNLELVSVVLNDQVLHEGQYTRDDTTLVIHDSPARCTLELEVLIRPQENTALEGLYPSGEFLLTQCEAEGFRKITYFPDRPDVMTRFEVTIVADSERYPVLLSNGNPVDSGTLSDGRHWVCWDDPFAKPCYLFALVAGDLACVEDQFVTRGGREVALRIYVEAENLDRCDHALESLIHSMKWDEDRFNLEYDLDIYNIVATNDFNMGAMENKSLNIFNSKYVLARPDTATDTDYQGIEGVIAHEYFHNWTGNRVTCRDWFQLTLKEGLTVFRDQEFSSDMQSRAVKRIRDVRGLRSRQFPEDAGPMAHPIRPDKYIEINNFYTMTVYQKGAEIIRMYHTLLGEDGFQRGMQLYFERHDGEAVTCDDFRAAMADANDADLEKFGRWYSQSGTPQLTVAGEYDPGSKCYTLHCRQHTPANSGQPEKQPLVIPIVVGLISAQGKEMTLKLAAESGHSGTSRTLVMDQEKQSFVFEGVDDPPVPSLLRGYSAPVKLEYPYSSSELAVLMAHDSDDFVRWEAAQLLSQREILANVRRMIDGEEPRLAAELVTAYQALLADTGSDPALVSEALALPAEDYLAELVEIVEVDAIHAARKFVKASLAERLKGAFLDRYQSMAMAGPYSKTPEAMARRSLRNVCLSFLLEAPGGFELAQAQLQASNNMTDTLAALQGLVWSGAPSADAALQEFYDQWRDDQLVMDKWFAIQAAMPGSRAVDRVRELLEHPGFSISNPNKVRSLIGVFAMMNPTGFHTMNGAGYRLHADQVLALDAINPQIAARMAGAFNAWTRYDKSRQQLMHAELKRIAGVDDLSPDVAEIINNALGMKGVKSEA